MMSFFARLWLGLSCWKASWPSKMCPPKAPNALNGKPKDDEEDPPIVCPDGTAVLCHKDFGFELNLNKGSQIDPLLVFLLKNANQKYIYFIKNKLFLKQLVFELRCWVPMRFA